MRNEGMSQAILTSVLPAARSASVLFAYTTAKWDEPYVSVQCQDATYSIVRKVLPNDFSRMYLVCVDGAPVGSVLFVEIATNILHMVGMFIAKVCRGKKIHYILNNKDCTQTVASFLLQHVMNDLASKNLQVTLEVMNYNESAHRLYESIEFFSDNKEQPFKFHLCSKAEIIEYKTIRKKKIKKWHDIGQGEDKPGVQWSHIPDYNDESTWSVTRVYCWKKLRPPLTTKQMVFTRHKLKFIYSVVKYGDIIGCVYYYLCLRIKLR